MGDGPLDAAGAVPRARRLADLSQRDLADAVGVSQPTVVRWESGRGDPPLDLLQQVLAVAGLRLAVVADDGTLVRPVHRDSVRDNADRRFPAHLDVAPRDERPRPPPEEATATTPVATTPVTTARPPDHPTTTELEFRVRMRRHGARWGPARGLDIASDSARWSARRVASAPRTARAGASPAASGRPLE